LKRAEGNVAPRVLDYFKVKISLCLAWAHRKILLLRRVVMIKSHGNQGDWSIFGASTTEKAPVRIISWNLAHQTRIRRIPERLIWVLERLRPDILTLNEYVHDPTREAFLDDLASLGLVHTCISKRIGQNNQVLITSKQALDPIGSSPLLLNDGIGESNILRVRLMESGLELVGVRVPAYRSRLVLRAYWERLVTLMGTPSEKPVMFIGDLNADTNSKHVGSAFLSDLQARGWNIPTPAGPWSHTSGSRIDQVIASPSLKILSVSYMTELDGLKLASKPVGESVSDHAALIVDMDNLGITEG